MLRKCWIGFYRIFLLVIIICSSLLIYYINRPHYFAAQKVNYIFLPGATPKTLANNLQQLGIISEPKLFYRLLLLEKVHTKLQSGEYQFVSGMSLQKIINKIVTGDVERFQITLVDGWTFKQVMHALDNNPNLQHVLSGLSPQQITAKLHLDYANPEGLFLPETYQFIWPDSDLSILMRANEALIVVLNAEWQTSAVRESYQTPYQALIVASLIQKESANLSDRYQISGVIYRRLQKKMRLQIDPTVIYALGDHYSGKLTRNDLKFNSAYNTYRHRGLPPTPIALAGASAIHAAMHPAEGDALYFVAMGNGTHYFSSTLQQHDRAVLQYLLHKPSS